MSNQCLNCGKPLGGQGTLCYSCRSDGVSPEEVVDIDEGVESRVERYFIVSAVKCPNCDDLHGTVTHNGKEYTADDFGIDNLEAWQVEMDKEEEWIKEHPTQVQAVLPRIEDEWPESVRVLRNHIL